MYGLLYFGYQGKCVKKTMLNTMIKSYVLSLFLTLAMIPVALADTATVDDSTEINPLNVQSGSTYVLAEGDGVYVPTEYYGAPDTQLVMTKGFCPSGFTATPIASVYGTPNSDSMDSDCTQNSVAPYGIRTWIYCNTTPTGYQVMARAHMRYPASCPDEGVYLSYIVTCSPGGPGGCVGGPDTTPGNWPHSHS